MLGLVQHWIVTPIMMVVLILILVLIFIKKVTVKKPIKVKYVSKNIVND